MSKKKFSESSRRGIRTIEPEIQKSDQLINKVVEDYCLVVRSAITDDGRPPLETSGLKLHERLNKIEQSITKDVKKGELSKHLLTLQKIISQGLEKTKKLWPDIEVTYKWVKQRVKILENQQQQDSESVKREYQLLMNSMLDNKEKVGERMRSSRGVEMQNAEIKPHIIKNLEAVSCTS